MTKRWQDMTRNEQTEIATELFRRGLTASMAAVIVDATRNMISGKWNRLGLKGRAAIMQKPRASKKRLPRRPEKIAIVPQRGGRQVNRRTVTVVPEPVKIPEIKQHEENPTHLSVLRDSQCHWPLWGTKHDDNFQVYCGAPAVSLDRPYCEHHTELRRSPATRQYAPSRSW